MLTKQTLDQKYQIDILAEQTGGYSATKTERCFVEELARRAWEEREDECVEL